MRTTLFVLFVFVFIGCTNTPEVQTSKETLAKQKIQNNKTEAQVAKEEYLRLQKHRASQ